MEREPCIRHYRSTAKVLSPASLFTSGVPSLRLGRRQSMSMRSAHFWRFCSRALRAVLSRTVNAPSRIHPTTGKPLSPIDSTPKKPVGRMNAQRSC